jgi:hypothetical protein
LRIRVREKDGEKQTANERQGKSERARRGKVVEKKRK